MSELADTGKIWSIVRSAMGTVQYLYERELTPSERDAFIDAHSSEYAEKIAKLCSPRPVPTSERVPTKADADCNGAVWWWNTSDACWAYVPWSANLNLKYWTFWQPTGLTRPDETPEEVKP